MSAFVVAGIAGDSESADSPACDAAPTAPAPLPLPELEARLTELAGHLNAAEHRFLVLVAEFDRREGWADGATRSCAHWLGWKCGIEMGAARERVRVARALEALPAIGAAMARGELSYSKVRALTRVATEQTEDTLLMIALHGTAQHVEAVVRGYRRASRAGELELEARQHAGRALRWWHDEDGALVLQARLTAEGGAIVLRALQAGMEGDVPAGTPDPRHVPAGTPTAPAEPADTHAQRRADALVRLAERGLAAGERAPSGAARPLLVVHVDAATLAADAPGRSGPQHGPVLAAETVRRLGCDASLQAIVHDARGRVLDVGRRTRSIPAPIGRALEARDAGCRYPGCTERHRVDAHHVRHWAHGGATRLSNLVLLCRRHHRRVHEGGAAVRMTDDGVAVFTDARGRRIEAAPATRGSAEAIVADHARHGPAIGPQTATGRWRGERLDLGLAVAGLCCEQARGGRAKGTPTGKGAAAP